jgi:hypothetical protein
MGRICPVGLLFANAALLVMTAHADWRTDAGFVQLKAELGGAIPTGTGIPVMMSEASQSGHFYAQGTTNTLSYAGTGILAGKTIIPYSGVSGPSSHAATVANNFCGNTSSVSPGVTELHAWLADDFAVNLYNTNPLPSYAGSVQNHSWAGSLGSTSVDNDAIRAFDFMINRDARIATIGISGGNLSPLLGDTYHGITAGVRSGNHSISGTLTDGAGRM